MKMPFRSIITGLLIICTFFFVECKKEASPDNSYGMPNATETGANIFAAELVGIGAFDAPTYTTFIADNDVNNPFYYSSGNGAWLNVDTLTIAGAPQAGSYFKGIQFTIIGNLQQGATYSIDGVTTIAVTSTDSTCNGVSLFTVTAICDSGTVQLTKLDTVNKIVSGIFACSFPFSNCDSTIYANEGRFDYKYH